MPKLIKFYRPLGTTVPGGPYAYGKRYLVNEDVLNNFLVRALLVSGEAEIIDIPEEVHEETPTEQQKAPAVSESEAEADTEKSKSKKK